MVKTYICRLNGMMILSKGHGMIFARWMGEICKRTMSGRTCLMGEQLTERSLIRIQGSEVVPYLQGLITNDMRHLGRGSNIMYAMILNNTGRVMYDTLIYRTGEADVYMIECDKTVVNELKRHLRLFRVRRKIDVDAVGTDYLPWVVFHGVQQEQEGSAESSQYVATDSVEKAPKNTEGPIILDLNTDFNCEEVLACQDPRLRALGFRVVMPKPYSFTELSKLFSRHKLKESAAPTGYKYLRYSLGVGEGIQDHPQNKCFPLEANCDFLHGVSFHKGCYVGQELTARVHHTGVIRKRLMPIRLPNKVDEGAKNVESVGGTVVGSLRGVVNDVGLALLRVEQVLKMSKLIIDGEPCKVIIPDWWPKEHPTKHLAKEKHARST